MGPKTVGVAVSDGLGITAQGAGDYQKKCREQVKDRPVQESRQSLMNMMSGRLYWVCRSI